MNVRRLTIATVIGLVCVTRANAQELDVRAFSPAPIGTTIVIAGVGGSKGGILFDPSIGVTNAEADLHIVTTAFGYTFNLAGRQARVLAVLPIAWGRVAGALHAVPQRQDLRGLADPRIRMTIGLRGAPARTASELATAPRRAAVGASLTIMPPWGQYDAAQLINLGYHRWAFKPEIGATRTVGRWTLDGATGVWLFTTNRAYFPGERWREQDPLVSVQGHVSYTFLNRVWAGVHGTWFGGGETRTDGVVNPDEQRNTRLGATLSIPMGRVQSLKIVYSTGATTRRGTDFDSLSINWQLVRF